MEDLRLTEEEILGSQDSFTRSWQQIAMMTGNGSFPQLMDDPLVTFEMGDPDKNIDFVEIEAEILTHLSEMDPGLNYVLPGILDQEPNTPRESVDFEGNEQPGHSSVDLVYANPPSSVDMTPTVHQVTLPDSTRGAMIPSNTNYHGAYGFNVFIEEQPLKLTKSTSYTYSESLDKLYINMGTGCLVNFQVDSMPPDGCVIRTLPIFDKADHVGEVVRRCPTHSLPGDPSNLDHVAHEHLVRCDNDLAQYYCDPRSGRLSVTVPFVAPQVGTTNTQYLYKFMCFGSCVGGLNRRPLMLIYSLEKNGEVLGRRALRVRICACPGRDRKTEERQLDGASRRKGHSGVVQTVTTDFVVGGPAPKKVKSNEEFVLVMKSKVHYEILRKIKESLELSDLVPETVKTQYLKEQASTNIAVPALTSNCHSQRTSSGGESAQSSTAASVNRGGSVTVKLEVPTSSTSCSNMTNGACAMGTDGTSVKQRFYTISSFLQSIGMGAYADIFTEKGLVLMSQMVEYNEDDLNELRIGEAHRKVIWEALSRYPGHRVFYDQSSQGSCYSMPSSGSTQAGGRSSLIQVARCRLRKVISIPKERTDNQ